VTKTALTIALSEEELISLDSYCQKTNCTKTDVIREYIHSLDRRPRENLFKEVVDLRQELKEVKQEKADLELLIETITDHSSNIEDDFKNQAKAAKRETEEQFQAITEAMPVAVLISRVDNGEILYANLTACKNFQTSEQDFLGQSIGNSCYHQQDYLHLLETFAQEGEIKGSELLCCTGDRQEFWVNASLHPLKYQGQETILWALSDIHTLKQAQADLNYAKEQLQAVLDAIPGSVSWVSCDGYYLGVNSYLAERVGLPVEDFMNQEIGFLGQQGNFEDFINRFLTSPETSISEELSLEVLGEKQYILMAGQKYNQGQAIVTVGLDITQRKEAEEALRITEENYRSIFENALEGIFQSTPEGRYMSVNPAMARIYGYDSPQEMIDSINQIEKQIYVNAKDRYWFQDKMQTDGAIQDWQYEVYRRDGQKIWLSEHTRAVHDGAGNVLYYEGIVQEITKRKQEEDDLKRQVAELRIEIDQQKRDHQVKEITQSSYFMELQSELEMLTFDDDDF